MFSKGLDSRYSPHTNDIAMPRVAILTPVFRHGQYLPEMLLSLQAQTVTDWECALVLDGPDDEIEKIARRFAFSDPRIAVHVLPAWVGLPGARNECWRRTSAPWLLCFDADDVMDPTLLEEMLALAVPALGEGPPWPLVYSPAREWFPDGKTKVWRYPEFNAAKFADYHQIPGPSLMPRALYSALGGYNETMLEGGDDWEFLCRAVARKWITPLQLAESRWWYRQHDGPRVSRQGMKRWDVLQPLFKAILAAG